MKHNIQLGHDRESNQGLKVGSSARYQLNWALYRPPYAVKMEDSVYIISIAKYKVELQNSQMCLINHKIICECYN